MKTITMSKEEFVEQVIWCNQFNSNITFVEPMQLTFEDEKHLMWYLLRWGT